MTSHTYILKIVVFVMKSLLLIEAAGIAQGTVKIGDLRKAATREAFIVFHENVTRTARLIEVPAFSAFTADAHRLAAHRVCGGEPTAKRLSRIPHLGEKIEKIMADQINHEPNTVGLAMEAMLKNLDNFVQRTPQVRPIFESFLNAILIQAWASLEVLARQLLQDTINKHPKCFPSLSTGEMTALGGGSFQKLDSIRSAYRSAFQNEPSILNKLDEQCVDGLYHVRNILVHKAGVVDGHFRAAMGRNGFTAWQSLPDGPFPTTGTVIRGLVDPNVKCGYSLLKSVDDWIFTNEPKI